MRCADMDPAADQVEAPLEWSGAVPFLTMVQAAIDPEGTEAWGDQFLRWYQPEKWLGEHRAAAVWLGQKLRGPRLDWVPVDERLPDDNITVICWLEPGGEWFSGWHADGRWHDAASGGAMEGVTHWAEPVGPNVRAKRLDPAQETGENQ